MNNKIILIFAMFFASLLAVNFANAAPVTCLRTVDDYWCTEVSDIKYCDADYGTAVDPAQCAPVCCVNVEGQCNSFLTKIECEAFGGTAIGAGSCYNENQAKYQQCSIGSCNLAGDIKFGVSKSECDVLAAKNGLGNDEYSFSVETSRTQSRSSSLNIITGRVTHEEEYEDQQSLSDQQNFDANQDNAQNTQGDSNRNANTLAPDFGCCVVGDSCDILKKGSCIAQGGKFNAGKICGQIDECANNCQGTTVECSQDGSAIVTRNGCSEIIDVNTCSASTYCKINSGQAQCVSNDCSTGGKIVFPEINVGGGKTIPSKEAINIDNKMLGGKNRKDGESWCMVFGQVKGDNDNKNEHDVYFLEKSAALKTWDDEIWKHSAGLTTYRFSCNNGEVSSSQCGGEFRDEVCISSFETDLINKGDFEEKDLYCEKSDYGEKLNDYVSRSRNNYEQASCEQNKEDQIDKCKANFPKGSIFYQPETSSPPISSNIQPECSLCGKGAWNVCNEDECRRLGDCTAVGPGLGKIAGNCAKYALLAEALWLTAGSINPTGGGAFANPGWAGALTPSGIGFTSYGPLYFVKSELIPYAIYFGVGFFAYGQVVGDIRNAVQGQPPDPGYIGDGRIQR